MGGVVALSLLAAGCSGGTSSRQRSVSGTIETDEVRVASRYGGRIAKLLAQEGDALKAGQGIAELEAAELKARRDQVAAQLAELQAGPRQQEIDAAKHDWEALVASSAQARVDATRAVELFAQKTLSATEHEQALTRASTLEKNVASPCACASAINENGVAQQGFFHVYFQEADDFVLLLSKVN